MGELLFLGEKKILPETNMAPEKLMGKEDDPASLLLRKVANICEGSE